LVEVRLDETAPIEAVELTPDLIAEARLEEQEHVLEAATLIDGVGSLTKATPRRYGPWWIPSAPYRAVGFDQADELRIARRRTQARTAFHLQIRQTTELTSDSIPTDGEVR